MRKNAIKLITMIMLVVMVALVTIMITTKESSTIIKQDNSTSVYKEPDPDPTPTIALSYQPEIPNQSDYIIIPTAQPDQWEPESLFEASNAVYYYSSSPSYSDHSYDNSDLEELIDSEESSESEEVEYVLPLSEDDQTYLKKIAWAEAGNQDTKGKALVMRVVLNRVDSELFPDDVLEVILQKNQFSPVASGTFWPATDCDEGCIEALEMIMNGWDESQGATYFESNKKYDSWHYRNLTFLFEYGAHWFYY